MQIRLTVLGPAPATPGSDTARAVLVTAPTGTALASVLPALTAAAAGPVEGHAAIWAGGQRLDSQRATLGEPPLIDGATLHLGTVGAAEPQLLDKAAQLHVTAGPDAGGVHLLHGGQVVIGRSAEAGVPLDDPDVSRLHCAVSLEPDGRITAQDLGSTNGTTLDGQRVGGTPVAFTPGSVLRIGESTLRLAPGRESTLVLATSGDGEGRLRVSADRMTLPAPQTGSADRSTQVPSPRPPADDLGTQPSPGPLPDQGGTHHGYGHAAWDAPGVPPQGVDDSPGTPGTELDRGSAPGPGQGAAAGAREGSPRGLYRRQLAGWARRFSGGAREEPPPAARDRTSPGPGAHTAREVPDFFPDPARLLLTALGPGPRLWERDARHRAALTVRLGTVRTPAPGSPASDAGAPEGPRAQPGFPASAPDGLRAGSPLTFSLRETSLALSGPRRRLTGLARNALAQLAALHSPDELEIVLVATDRVQTAEERAAEWSWLGWLPHVRPAHGQDCRLLLAFDREQAIARTSELQRRLDDFLADTHRPGAPAAAVAAAVAASPAGLPIGPAADLPGPDSTPGERASVCGSTVLVVDGDPGTASVREAVARLAREGAPAGIHVLFLATTDPAAPPGEPLTAAYERARTGYPLVGDCGASALIRGDVATRLTLLTAPGGAPASAPSPGPVPGNPQDFGPGVPDGSPAVAPGAGPAPDRRAGLHGFPVPRGPEATVDAVSAVWAERFARALAPLRTAGRTVHPPVSAPLPQSARLLEELGLGRATPASLLARWAEADDRDHGSGGRAVAVLGAGPRGPVPLDLAADGPHVLIEGPAGSGRSELLRTLAASLSAAERPDRLALVLVDGRGTAPGPASPDGLSPCMDLPHATTHLAANDPVRMREFAQAVTAELKRRAELVGQLDFGTWHARLRTDERPGNPRDGERPTGGVPESAPGADLGPPSITLRLRPGFDRPDPGPPLPRLVLLVDDVDVLLAPPLGAPGRPSAGSVIRALEAVLRDGERLGVHLVAVRSLRAGTWPPAEAVATRVVLETPGGGPDDPAPGRGALHGPGGLLPVPLQAGRVSGRIPRTSTLRPTVVPLEWERMGDPPARRPVRELGNGPTDLALLASALDRAAGSASASAVPSLL